MPQNLRWAAVCGFSLKDERGARIVADNLEHVRGPRRPPPPGFTSTAFGRRLARLRIAADGSLGDLVKSDHLREGDLLRMSFAF